jgi:hypothetical protein
MQRLRTARFLARLVLAWFVLCLGAAAAASALQPQGLEMVCSGGSMKLLPAQDSDDGNGGTLRIGLDCPLCSPAAAPPPAPLAWAPAAGAHAVAQPGANRALPRPPALSPPARGPPAAA